MLRTKKWSTEIFIDEQDDGVHAEVRLHTCDNTHLVGVGVAATNPDDVNVPEIDDEIAVARALANLSRELLHAATEDIEGIHDQRAQR
ncbi:DUF1876 domain-containing protein [Fodinicola acaciae]|uniref:DUF1876 domain-containing protein n=1 Tax=Fodinicola acaciae TaxID=2681555 RepID=UPI0013D4654C|nr:DUF1876 domain-containing protein [Fodinicola acaciae]